MGCVQKELSAHVQDRAGPTTNVAFSHCGNYFVTKGYGDTTIRLYDTWTGRALVQVPGAFSDIRVPLQFSADDRWLACSVEDQRLRLWKVELPTAYHSFREVGHLGEEHYLDLDVHSSGRILAAAAQSRDVEAGGVALWDLHSGLQTEFLKIGNTRTAIFHPLGNALISSGDAGAYYWPIRFDDKSPDVCRIGPPRRLLPGRRGNAHLSSDGRRLAVQAWAQGTVIDLPDQDSPASSLFQESRQLLQLITGQKAKVQVSHANMSRLSLSPNGRWLATGTHNGKDVKIWNAQTGKLVKDLPVPWSANVAFSPDGRWFVTYCREKYHIHETDSWELRHEIPNVGGGSDGPIAFRPDGRVLAVQVSGFQVQLLDPESAQVFATLNPPDRDQSYANRIYFSPDGKQLLSCTGVLRLIHVWNLHRAGRAARGHGPALGAAAIRRSRGSCRAPATEGERATPG